MELMSLSNKHKAILNFLISNPSASMEAVATEFGFTRAWLSTVIHSNAFQAQLREAQEKVFLEVTMPLREKIEGVAHRAYEKLGEKLDDSQDARFILEVADKAAHRLGFAPNKGITVNTSPGVENQQNNFYLVDKETLASARNTMQAIREAEEEVGTNIDNALPSPKKI